jgi:hypothetical protein
MGKQYNKVEKARRRKRRLKRKKVEAAEAGMRAGRVVRPRLAARTASKPRSGGQTAAGA